MILDQLTDEQRAEVLTLVTKAHQCGYGSGRRERETYPGKLREKFQHDRRMVGPEFNLERFLVSQRLKPCSHSLTTGDGKRSKSCAYCGEKL